MIAPMFSVGRMKLTLAIGSRNSSMSPGVGDAGRVGDVEHLALAGEDLVGHVGRGLDQRQVALAFEPLLDDLHVEHAQEPAAEPEAEGVGGFGLEGEAGVVERELLKRGAEVVELVVRGGKQAAEDDLDGLLDNPGRASRRASWASVMVSPMRTSASFLMLA